MDIVVLGINHKTAPVQLREKLAFSERQIEQALQFTVEKGKVSECIILSTCNRTEVYVTARDEMEGREEIFSLLAEQKNPITVFPKESIYIYSGRDAAQHLFRVASGLDSMIPGETQILGQVRQAYEVAVKHGSVGKVLHALFRQALSCGKRVHSETKIGENAASVSYAAVKLAEKTFERFDRCSILVVGAGEMSELTLKHLHARGAGEIMIINRTRERAEALARTYAGNVCSYERLEKCLEKADIVISSTGAPHFIIQKTMLAPIMRLRKNCPLFLIDAAVPRDIEPSVHEIENVYLYNIDDLNEVVASNLNKREKGAAQAEKIVCEEAATFMSWFKTLDVVPVITALRRRGESIREEELQKMLESRLEKLAPKEQKAVEKLTRVIVNRILREPVLRIKEIAMEDKGDICLATLYSLFNLEQGLICESGSKTEEKVIG